MSSSIPERTVESWLAVELELWFPGVRLWAPTHSAAGNWDLSAQGVGKLLIFECKGCNPLQRGHSVPINMPQLQRYAVGAEFGPVRRHVVYVLPSPPWSGAAPSPGAPFTPSAALPVAYADQRLVGPAGGCWEWFHVVPAMTLWRSLMSAGLASVNTRRLPSPPSLNLAPHRLGRLPGTQRLADFLEDVARCRRIPLTGVDPGGPGRGAGPDSWRRPPGRGPSDDSGPAGDDEPAEPPDVAAGVVFEGEPPEGSAPTPLAAFVPRGALAA